jgi:hypothetical protein
MLHQQATGSAAIVAPRDVLAARGVDAAGSHQVLETRRAGHAREGEGAGDGDRVVRRRDAVAGV